MNHDDQCESELTSHGQTPCRCEERAAARILGKLGGAAKTEKKQQASRQNGKKGGRPKKEQDDGK